MKCLKRLSKKRDWKQDNEIPQECPKLKGIVSAKNKYDVLRYVVEAGWISTIIANRLDKACSEAEEGIKKGTFYFFKWDRTGGLFAPNNAEYYINLDEIIGDITK